MNKRFCCKLCNDPGDGVAVGQATQESRNNIFFLSMQQHEIGLKRKTTG